MRVERRVVKPQIVNNGTMLVAAARAAARAMTLSGAARSHSVPVSMPAKARSVGFVLGQGMPQCASAKGRDLSPRLSGPCRVQQRRSKPLVNIQAFHQRQQQQQHGQVDQHEQAQQQHEQQWQEQQQQRRLGPGVVAVFGGRRFQVLRPLGKGSFGVVWAAQDDEGATVAIKEIPCSSEAEVGRVTQEGRLLELVEQELSSVGCDTAFGRLPVLVASDAAQVAEQKWRVRLAMSLVAGIPLESFLENRHREEERGSSVENRCQFAQAGRYAGELLVQLPPLLEAFSGCVYHRDITPRNILIQKCAESDHLHFGLVDFGLAVDARRWRAGEKGAGDLGGDGRYWPASAWFVFGHGTRALEQEPWMRWEYRTCLDMHSLGLTALRCLLEMLPSCLDCSHVSADASLALLKLQDLRTAWSRYWSDAKRFWQPIYDAFRGKGSFDILRSAYVRAGVHRIIGEDIALLRAAIREARGACERAPVELGVAGMPPLLDALLLMVQIGKADDPQPSDASLGADNVPTAVLGSVVPEGSGKVMLARSHSMSTASPDSSPLSSIHSGSSGFGDLE